jgi:ABC-type phosphate transport system substrate-binding protein
MTTLGGAHVWAGEVAVVVNPKTASAGLDKSAMREIYTGNKTKWADGKKIEFVVLADSGDINETFMNQFVGKTVPQFVAFWKKQVFTGKGAEPKTVKTEKDVLDYVAATDGAIGYVAAGSVSGSVKAVPVK